MATLTKTAYLTRRIIAVFLASMIGFFVVRASVSAARDIWRKFSPPAPPPPTLAFDKIPAIQFLGPKESLPKLTFMLETIEGGLPELPTIGKVYFMPQKEPGLLDLDRAIQRARLFGFRGSPEAVSEVAYRWQTSTEPVTTLEINANTNNFYLRHAYEENPNLLNQQNLPNDSQAFSEAKTFLKNKGYLTEDLEEGEANFVYFRFIPPKLEPAVSFSEANFVRVNLFRANLDDLRILPPYPKESLISFLFSGSRNNQDRIVEVKYTHFPIEREIFATYPLKTPEAAWQELQAGRGHIANLGQNPSGKITIREVSLAYFDSGQEQDFLQPIFVFEGDRDFIAYISALDSQWIRRE